MDEDEKDGADSLSLLIRWKKLNYHFKAEAQRTQRNPSGKGLKRSARSASPR